jgi:hypothetical protein
MNYTSLQQVFAKLFCAGSFAALATIAVAQTVPSMTIEIHNNSDNYNIYPVLSTGAHETDTWLQAIFKIPKSQLGDHPYPNPKTFRLYLNPTGTGIPPHSSVALKLPLYTQLVPTNQVDPALPGQYIDWWDGGRVSIYAGPASDSVPPQSLMDAYSNRPSQTLVAPVAGAVVPTCATCQRDPEIFSDSDGELPSNDPAQIIEYTLGAIDLTQDPYKLDVKNVDYDVSYVDNAFLPAAIEPYNNPVVGWIGTTQTIDSFKTALDAFLATSPYKGWPQYVDNGGQKVLKVPSALHIMQDQVNLTPAPPWAPVENMKTLWQTCTTGGVVPNDKEVLCKDIKDVYALFTANFKNYIDNYRTSFGGKCDQEKGPEPASLDDAAMLAQVYGWGPFNKNCDADANLLEDTPGYNENNYAGYQAVKAEFDELNYWPSGEFNPYVQLIHGQQYLNAKYVYAYSVDDAVGNMQTTGEGLIIAVGGSGGLPNPDPATSPIHITFGYSSADRVRFLKYGVCTDTPDRDINPNFASFDLSANQLSNCTISVIDNNNLIYKFKVTKRPPYGPRPEGSDPHDKSMIDCSDNMDAGAFAWCSNIYGFTVSSLNAHSKEDDYITTPAPAQLAAPAPEPRTKLSAEVARVFEHGRETSVKLMIRNTGNTEIDSAVINHVRIRTIDGYGRARLLSSAPICIDKLSPGESAWVALRVEISDGVRRLMLTETGTVVSNAKPSAFKLSQTILNSRKIRRSHRHRFR